MTFENTPYHDGQQYAGQDLEWLPTDTKEHYEELIKDPKHYEYFKQQGWTEPGAITYKINRQGFRSDEFDNSECMIALGCSYTLGTGLPVDTTWPQLVGKSIGLKVANLAWNGFSADSCYRMLRYWIDQLNCKLVCMLTPPTHRVEVFMDQDFCPVKYYVPVMTYMPQGMSDHWNPNDVFLNNWFAAPENAIINNEKNRMAIKQLCAERSIPCFIEEASVHMAQSREEIGYARDHFHGGPIIHNRLATGFINDWNETKQP